MGNEARAIRGMSSRNGTPGWILDIRAIAQWASQIEGVSKVIMLDLVREPMKTHNRGYAHTLLKFFIFIQKATLRFFNNYSLRPLVYHLQVKLS
jgi:hypothetical protein